MTGTADLVDVPRILLTTVLVALVVGLLDVPVMALPLEGSSAIAPPAAPGRPVAAVEHGVGVAPRPTAIPDAAVGTHRWPVDGGVVGVWDATANPYAAGHRGVDLSVESGQAVRASAPGSVSFAGVVAGRAWVSVDHAHGVRTTVGPMATITVAAGDRVTPSTVLGTAAATAHADGRRPRTGRLHWSARIDGTYVDPAPLVGRLVATLLPTSWHAPSADDRAVPLPAPIRDPPPRLGT